VERELLVLDAPIPTTPDYGRMTPPEFRAVARAGQFKPRTTRNVALGHVQCALVVLPKDLAFDFLVFCQRNQRPCPVLEVTDPGSPEPRRIAPGADLRTDLPLYSVYRKGKLEAHVESITDLWRDDLVAFFIGSNTSCDLALNRVGVQTERNRWVLRTGIETDPAGPFRGPMVVTMRWLTPKEAIAATQLTGRFPFNHGAPIHIGDPAAIGADLANPMMGEPVKEIPRDLVPVFWACSMTPQAVAIAAGVEFMLTSGPSQGFISDLESDKVCIP
jgi:uncharacterized protein YcsI (UPF0317 family)